jgi:hypothetical protein
MRARVDDIKALLPHLDIKSRITLMMATTLMRSHALVSIISLSPRLTRTVMARLGVI